MALAKLQLAFTWYCSQSVPVTAPFSKSTNFKTCQLKMYRFPVNGGLSVTFFDIFHRFQNVPASCGRSLGFRTMIQNKVNNRRKQIEHTLLKFERFSAPTEIRVSNRFCATVELAIFERRNRRDAGYTIQG